MAEHRADADPQRLPQRLLLQAARLNPKQLVPVNAAPGSRDPTRAMSVAPLPGRTPLPTESSKGPLKDVERYGPNNLFTPPTLERIRYLSDED
jgi:hypothetical protein